MNGSRTVLVVEDDDPIRDILLEILNDQGYDAVGAANGRDALDLLRSLEPLPCLVLLDLMMPVMDGAAFREAQVRDPSLAAIPVVVLSAYADAAAQARRMGATGFLKKPVEVKRVVELARTYCAVAS
jgi:CheY-like chemotaxis protein